MQTQKHGLQVSDTPRHGWRGWGANLRTSSKLKVGPASPENQFYYNRFVLNNPVFKRCV